MIIDSMERIALYEDVLPRAKDISILFAAQRAYIF